MDTMDKIETKKREIERETDWELSHGSNGQRNV